MGNCATEFLPAIKIKHSLRVFHFCRDRHRVGRCNEVAGFGTSAQRARSERGPQTKFVGITIPRFRQHKILVMLLADFYCNKNVKKLK